MFTDLRLRRVALMLLALVLIFTGCGDDPTDPPDDGLEWNFYMFGHERLDAESVAVDQDGTVWCGTKYMGVYELNPEDDTWVHHTQPGGVIQDIHVDANNVVWFASEEGGLWKYENNEFTQIPDLPDDNIWAVTTDLDGDLWVGTERDGLLHFDGENWTVYDVFNSVLTSDWVYSLDVDSENNVWIGLIELTTYGYTGGLVKFNRTEFNFYTMDNSDLPSNNIAVLEIDVNDQKWIGTDNGIAVFDDQNWTLYNTSNSDIPDWAVEAISFDNFGNAWIGTMSHKIAKFDGINWTIFNPKDYGAYPFTGSMGGIFFDNDTNTVWAAYYAGGLISMTDHNN